MRAPITYQFRKYYGIKEFSIGMLELYTTPNADDLSVRGLHCIGMNLHGNIARIDIEQNDYYIIFNIVDDFSVITELKIWKSAKADIKKATMIAELVNAKRVLMLGGSDETITIHVDAPEYKLIGYIAGDTFKSQGNSHFANMGGHVVCGQTNRFGMDCAAEIRFKSTSEFYTDQTLRFDREDLFNLRRNHLPLHTFITCKKCLKYLEIHL